jgi:Ca-activated chloride channel homolog
MCRSRHDFEAMHIDTHLDVDLVALESEDQVTLMLDLLAPATEAAVARPPATLQVVLDRSGSMAGERLDVAKHALILLIDRLDAHDRLGVVSFDDTVDVVVPAGPLGPHKDHAKYAVAELAPGGMTNLSGGLLRGLQEARRGAGPGGTATLLLLSDGHANVGVTQADQLADVSAGGRKHGVTISTFGIGLDYDEALMAALARGGTGNAHFAEEADTAGALLATEVDGLLTVSAQAASLLLRPSEGVETITLWNDLASVATADGIMVELGDLYAAEERKLVLTLDVPAMPALGLAKVADLTLKWVALPDLSEHTVEVPVFVNVVPGDQIAGRIPDAKVRTELAYQRAQKTKRDAARAMREGRVEDAHQLWLDGGQDLAAAAAAAPAGAADELLAEADVMGSFAMRSLNDDARRVAKDSETDSGWKSRKRGRR